MRQVEFDKEIGHIHGPSSSGALWIKDPDTGKWLFSRKVPTDGRTWIANDIHAELKKEWINKGMPPLQCLADEGWCNIPKGCVPTWSPNTKYRIKPQEWYDDIPEHGVLCWVKEGKNKRWFADVIIKYYPDDVYLYTSTWSSYKYAKPMTKDEAMKFIVE